MSIETNKEIILKMYQAFDQQAFEQAEEFIADDIVGHGLDGIPRQGIEAFIDYGKFIFAAFPDGYHQIEEAIAEEDKVVTRGIFCGTHQGELMGIPATGKEIKFAVVHIDRLVDGKVVEHWGQGDRFAIMQQLNS